MIAYEASAIYVDGYGWGYGTAWQYRNKKN